LTTSSWEEEVVVSCINMSIDLTTSSWEEGVVVSCINMSMDLTISSWEEGVVVSCINMSMDLTTSSWEEEVESLRTVLRMRGQDLDQLRAANNALHIEMER
jgi:hypothetical protein